jgi:L-seryl-tRNA(Ser) seleniumtransferase
VRESIAAGADVVMFSGDKLLGGPQAGIIAGTEASLSVIRRHPLMRALRVDKMTYAALEATLQEYDAGRAADRVPVIRMLSLTPADIERRARPVADVIAAAGFTTAIVDGESTIGGGSAPGSALPTRLIAVSHPSLTATALEAGLRACDPPVIARIDADRVVLDLRSVLPEDDELLGSLIRSAALNSP